MLNKVSIIGRLGQHPEVRTMQNGGKLVNMSVATTEQWIDKSSGERKTSTEWHRVCIYDDRLADLAENRLEKGSLVYLEGTLKSRKYQDKSGVEKSITEIVLQKFRGALTVLSGPPEEVVEEPVAPKQPARRVATTKPAPKATSDGQQWDSNSDLNDEIPF